MARDHWHCVACGAPIEDVHFLKMRATPSPTKPVTLLFIAPLCVLCSEDEHGRKVSAEPVRGDLLGALRDWLVRHDAARHEPDPEG